MNDTLKIIIFIPLENTIDIPMNRLHTSIWSNNNIPTYHKCITNNTQNKPILATEGSALIMNGL